MPNGKGYTVTFDGIASTDELPELIVARVRRKLLGKTRAVMREVAGRTGAWQFGEKRGLKTIILECSAITEKDGNSNPFPIPRREFLTRLAAWVDKEGFRKLVISDEPDRYYLATLVGEPDLDEWRDLSKFDLEFGAEPYPYEDAISNTAFSVTDNVAHPFAFADEVLAYPIVEIQAVGGNIGGFTLIFNGYRMDRTSDIPSGNVVTISSLSYTASPGTNTDTDLSGDFDPLTVEMSSVSGEFPVLIPGVTQSLTLTKLSGTATGANISITWRKRYP